MAERRVGAVAVYDGGAARVYAGNADERENMAAFGRLYNGWTVVHPRGPCLAGWRVPSASDWGCLIEALGGVCSAGQHMLPVPERRAGFDGSPGFNVLMGGGGGRECRGERLLLVDELGRADGMVHAVGGWTNRGMGASVRCVKE